MDLVIICNFNSFIYRSSKELGDYSSEYIDRPVEWWKLKENQKIKKVKKILE